MNSVRKARCRVVARPSAARADVLRDDRRREAGATLVLALIFMVVAGTIVGALMNELTNDLHNSAAFLSVRSDQYAAKSATDLAMNSIRYAYDSPSAPNGNTNTMLTQTLNASPPVPCWGTGATSELTVTNVSMDVWCSTAWDPTSTNTRVVTFSTCLDGVSAAKCAAQPYLLAVVTFDDYPSGVSAPSSTPCYLYCGTGMTTDEWLWSPTLPVVNTLSPSTGSILGGTSVTITGSGFATGDTVNFVEESNGSPATDNTVLQATNVVVNASTQTITASSPGVTEGTTYDVTVSTPVGTSAYTSNAVFTYTTVAPTVTSISPGVGSIAGGNGITVTGTGFYQTASQPIKVTFTQESGGTVPSNPLTYTVSSPNVILNGSTSITVISPAVAGGSSCSTEFCYFVTVTTPAGTSVTGNGNINDIFDYTSLTPLCSSISPTSGNAGTTVTIYGVGFLTSGTSASFVGESGGTANGSTVAATITSSSITPDQMTVTAPSEPTYYGQPESTSFVTVTTVTGTCQDQVIFTY